MEVMRECSKVFHSQKYQGDNNTNNLALDLPSDDFSLLAETTGVDLTDACCPSDKLEFCPSCPHKDKEEYSNLVGEIRRFKAPYLSPFI